MTVIRDQKIWLGSIRLDTKINTLSLEAGAETADDARLGDDTARVIATRKTGALNLSGFWDATTDAARELALFNSVGQPRVYAVACENGSEGETAYFGRMIVSARNISGSHGDNAGITVAGVAARNPMFRGIVAVNRTGVGSTFDIDGFELGQVTANQRLYAALFVTGGSDIDVDVVVESDEDDNFADPNEQIDFGNITAVGGVLASAAGPITDEWLRVVVTVNDGENIDIAVMLAIA
jgi:hypothetical protein